MLSLFSPSFSALAQTYPSSAALLSGTFTDSNPTPLPYRYFVPVGYDAADTTKKYPLVLFLHGQGERGTDNTAQLNNHANGAMIFISSSNPANQTNFPCFFLAPQCPGDAGAWDSGNAYAAEQAYALVSYFLSHFNIDPDRVYITGLSSGGGGTSYLLSKDPGRWAAAAICSGWAGGVQSSYDNIPLWSFHTANDPEVGIQGMDAYIQNRRSRGSNPIYSRYNTGGHSAWNQAYSAGTPLVPWMMAQRRGQPSIAAGPYVKITGPTTQATFATSGSTVVLSGKTGDSSAGTSSVYWENFSTWTGLDFEQGSITGIGNWMSSSIPLNNGRQNQLQIIGVGLPYGAASNNGNTTYSAPLRVNQAADSVAPTISINSPTNQSTYSTSSAPLNLSGNAADGVGLASVTWNNNRGGSGTASGTLNWNISGVVLYPGNNLITVTAADTSGNITSSTLTVNFTGIQINQAPTVSAGSNLTTSLPLVTTITGTAGDDGLPSGSSLTYNWTQFSGPAAANITNLSSLSTTVSFSLAGTYILRLTASDSLLSSSSDVTVTVNPASSSGWTPVDIGSPALPGGISLNNGIYTVQASGTDIWGTADSFHFDYQVLYGDGTMIARVTGIQNTDAWAKAAVMIRASLSADSAQAMTCLSSTQGTALMQRSTTGASSSATTVPGISAPSWVRLVRSGSTFSGSYSNNGTTWTDIGSVTINMPTMVYAGLALSSHNNSSLNTATFTNVSLTPAQPSSFTAWQTANFPNATDNGMLDDADHDGMPNLLEYALGGNPHSNLSIPTPAIGRTTISGNDYLTLQYLRPKSITDLTYTVQVSSDLVNWQQGSGFLSPVSTVDNGETLSVTVRDLSSVTSTPHRFMRLQVTR